jgi:hypothetical protein
MNKKTPFKSLVFEEKYKLYSDFYGKNKELIYQNIFEIFKEFKNTRKRILSLHISAKISHIDWDTELVFHKKESIVLKRDLIPFFEEIEDYETCHKINSLYNELTS